MIRKTKIICTLGPATDQPGILRQMILEGMNVARLNFSHGSHAEHLARIQAIKNIRKELAMPVAILLDTSGPEIRLGFFQNGQADLKQGRRFMLTGREIMGDSEAVSISYRELANDVSRGSRILLDDGLIELTVEEIDGLDIVCRVQNDGTISDRKSLNVPGIKLKLPYINKKDEDDIVFGIDNDIDYIAASFCRSAHDILDVKELLAKNNATDIKIIAKIENMDGVENADDILKVADGIMVARGDLGVEVDFIELPRIQKLLIKSCLTAGKTVIIATQMLESMVHNPRPTRAEISDVANAVYEGVSAIMLSGETAKGKYPLESLKTMASIAQNTEKDIDYQSSLGDKVQRKNMNLNMAIAHATCTTAHDLKAAAIVSFTVSGNTSRLVASFRPAVPIIACTPDEKKFNQLSLVWGVYPVIGDAKHDSQYLFDNAVELALSTGIVNHGDLVVITAGLPLGVSGSTNTLQVYIAGNILLSGKGLNQLSVSGPVLVAKEQSKLLENAVSGSILIVDDYDKALLPIYVRAKAIIFAKQFTPHGELAELLIKIPLVSGAKGATEVLRCGQIVTVDASRGIIYSGVTRTTTA